MLNHKGTGSKNNYANKPGSHRNSLDIKKEPSGFLVKNGNIMNTLFKSNIKVLVLIIMVAVIFASSFSCKKSTEETVEEVMFGPVYDVGEIIVNLSDMGQARYAKVQVILELSDEESLEEVTARSPQVRDIVIEIFSIKIAEDMLVLESRNSIKAEIRKRINSVLKDGSVRNVYFTTLVVQ